MRYFSLLVCLLVSLLALPNASIAAQAPPTNTPASLATSPVNTAQTTSDWQYQQLFAIHSQLARLDEQLKQQAALGSDVKALETTQQAIKVQLANLQTKLEVQEKVQINQLNGFDGRIGDIASNTNMWGMAFTIFGLIITVAAIALGFSAKNRAVYEAKLAANTASESHMEKWLLDNKDKLIEDTKTELEKVSLELKNRAEKLEEEAKTALEKIKQEQQQAWDALLAENKEIVTSKINKEEKTATKHHKPQAYQTVKEWFKAGINAFANSEYDDALNAWSKVLELVDSEQEPKLYAITMINQGVTYGRLGKPDDELNSYATLIEQFKGSSNEEIQIQMAKARFNQGITYGQQGKHNEALNSFNALIEQFKGSSNEAMQIQVAEAVANQGITYGQQGRFDEALNSFNALIEQFKDSSNEEIQIQVASAMNRQLVTYGRQKDFTTALNTYAQLSARFKDANNAEIKYQVKTARANIAELALLFETPEQVCVRITEVENTDEDAQVLAVMQFIRFLLGNNTIDDVLTAIAAIPKETELNWKFAEIKEYLTTKFSGEKLQHIQAVVAFFEQHKDIAQLKSELKIES